MDSVAPADESEPSSPLARATAACASWNSRAFSSSAVNHFVCVLVLVAVAGVVGVGLLIETVSPCPLCDPPYRNVSERISRMKKV